MEFKSKQCPNCGAELTLINGGTKLLCEYCDYEEIIQSKKTDNMKKNITADNIIGSNQLTQADILNRKLAEAQANKKQLDDARTQLLNSLINSGDKKTQKSASVLLGKSGNHIFLWIATIIVGIILLISPVFFFGILLIIIGVHFFRATINADSNAEKYLTMYHSDYSQLKEAIKKAEEQLNDVKNEIKIYNQQIS